MDDEPDPDDADEPDVPLPVRLVRLAGVLWVGHGVVSLAAGVVPLLPRGA